MRDFILNAVFFNVHRKCKKPKLFKKQNVLIVFLKIQQISHVLRSISFLRRSCQFSHLATICMQKLYEALKRNGAQIRPHTYMQICTHPLLSFKYKLDLIFLSNVFI